MGKGMPVGAYKREVAEPLNIIPYRFSFFLDRREELVHGHLEIILIESRNKLDFQVHPRIDGVTWKTPEPVKGYPHEGADE